MDETSARASGDAVPTIAPPVVPLAPASELDEAARLAAQWSRLVAEDRHGLGVPEPSGPTLVERPPVPRITAGPGAPPPATAFTRSTTAPVVATEAQTGAGETQGAAWSELTAMGMSDVEAPAPHIGAETAPVVPEPGVDEAPPTVDGDPAAPHVEGLIVRGRGTTMAPGRRVLPPADQLPPSENHGRAHEVLASLRDLVPTRADLDALAFLTTAQRVLVGASVVVCLPLLAWMGTDAYAAPRWLLLLLIALSTLFWLSTIGARTGFGRGPDLLVRPVNAVLVAAAGLLPPLSLPVLLLAPTGAKRVTDAVVTRAIRLSALTSAALCFHLAGLSGPVTVPGALLLLSAPITFWLVENTLVTYVPGRDADVAADDLGTWEPGAVARELGSASTGLVIVTAVVINPVLAIVAVPLVAGSVSAVLELARSREDDLDSATGLLNDAAFAYLAARELDRARRTGAQVSLLTLDLDNLASLTDSHGRHAGIAAVAGIARRIRSRLRSTDLACRVDGDRFTVLLPDTGVDGATAVAERIRGDVEGSPVLGRDGALVAISVSIGVVVWDRVAPVTALREAAATALFAAKADGHNRVVVAAPSA